VLFNDPTYLFVFLPATIVAYVAMRRLAGARAVLGLLVLVSLVFYGWWNPTYLPLLGGMTAFNFGLARAIRHLSQAGRESRANLVLFFGVMCDLLVLAYFKYTDFLIGSANALLSTSIPLQHIALPLGISFFTFQKIAYLVDASHGEVGEHDFLEFCFFVMFFPQLIAGPIVHHREIFPQIRKPQALAVLPGNLTIGLTIFVIGLFKKVVLADHLGPVATAVFDMAAAGKPLHFFLAWEGAIAYTLQLYFDFSGYSDMAIGSARLFGIRLPLNFNSPYQANNIIDFWKRWHMTLSRFLRDYLYIPLGGNRRGKARRYINLMLTMAIGGLWHGAAWSFALWGTLHGLYLVANHAWRAAFPPIDAWWSRGTARLVTLLAVVIAWVPFRAPTLSAAAEIYRGMTNLPQPLGHKLGPIADALTWCGVHFEGPPVSGADLQLVLRLIVWLAVLWLVPNTQQLLARFRPAFNYGPAERRRDRPLLARLKVFDALLEWRPNLVSAVVVGALVAIACLNLQHVSEFLYFEF
jgi:D-alanyl-lipoteichoic acid acyltransferase DltB (MBOAT superfamily)